MSSIEVQSWSPDGTTMLAILDGASSVQWTDLLGDVGSGSCVLSICDPKYTAGNVQKGNLVKFVLNGTPAFAFFNTAPKLTVGEAETSVIKLAGNAVLDYLGRALGYPPGGWSSPTAASYSWTGVTPGYILKTLIDLAQVRGTIPALTYDFTATKDSAGNSWTANVNLTVDAKATLLDVAKKLVALGIGIYMDPQLKLHAYVPGAQGANVSSTVIFQQGRHFIAPVDNVGSMPTTVALVAGTGGVFQEVSDSNYTSNPAYGRIETAVDYSTVTGNTTQLQNAGLQQIALSENAGQAITVKLNHGSDPGSFEPYQDYHLGDTAALSAAGSYVNTPAQVVGLTIVETPNANYTVDVNLGSIALPIELRLARMLASSSGTTSNVSGGVAGNLTLCNPHGFPTGTAYPLNPTSGMVWFRTDLGAWYEYTGGSWVLEGTGLAIAPASVAATGAVSGTSISVTSGNLARYVPLTTSYIQAVPDNSTTGAAIAQAHVAAMTGLPASGVVAVQVMVIAATSVINSGDVVLAVDYGATVNAGARVYCPPVANYSGFASAMVATGGTNNRQIDYTVLWGAGTITYSIRVIGYWTTA